MLSVNQLMANKWTHLCSVWDSSHCLTSSLLLFSDTTCVTLWLEEVEYESTKEYVCCWATQTMQNHERCFKTKQINCYHDVGLKIILLEHVFNVETLLPAQPREETSPTGSHFSLQKEQHDLWEFDGVCVLSPSGCSAASWRASDLPSFQWHHGPGVGPLP